MANQARFFQGLASVQNVLPTHRPGNQLRRRGSVAIRHERRLQVRSIDTGLVLPGSPLEDHSKRMGASSQRAVKLTLIPTPGVGASTCLRPPPLGRERIETRSASFAEGPYGIAYALDLVECWMVQSCTCFRANPVAVNYAGGTRPASIIHSH